MHILGPEMHIPKTMVASLGPFALPSGYFSDLSLSAGLACQLTGRIFVNVPL